jgi:hypothetical protein
MKIKKITYISGYKLKILFSNRKTKVIDFQDWIFDKEAGPYLKPLQNLEFFKQFSLDEFAYSICWPNGADFCPDAIYAKEQEHSNKKKPLLKKTRPRRKKTKSKV